MRQIYYFRFLVVQQMMAKLEYPQDFILQLVAVSIRQLIWIIFIKTIFSRIPEMHGWTFEKIVFLYALAIIPQGFYELFLGGIWTLPTMIRTGELDRLLIYPVEPVIHIFTQEISLYGFGNVVVGIGLLLYASANLSLIWELWMIVYLVIAIISGILIYAAITLTAASLSFWTTDVAVTFAVNQMAELSRFPLDIYPPIIITILTWVVPFAFTSYIPTAFLLHQHDSVLGIIAPLISIIMFSISNIIFKFGLRHYESTGN